MHTAVFSGSLDLVKVLVDDGRFCTSSPALIAACETGHTEIAAFLFQKNKDLSPRVQNYEPLAFAIRSNELEPLNLLLEHPLLTVDEIPLAELRRSIELGYTRVVKLLIDHGAKFSRLRNPHALELASSLRFAKDSFILPPNQGSYCVSELWQSPSRIGPSLLRRDA